MWLSWDGWYFHCYVVPLGVTYGYRHIAAEVVLVTEGPPEKTRDGLELSELPAVRPGELSMDGAKAIMGGWFEDIIML